MTPTILLSLHSLQSSPQSIKFNPTYMFNGSLAARNHMDVERHIEELRASGVAIADPKFVPSLYAVGRHLLTSESRIQVHGDRTSGEVEYVLLWNGSDILLTVGSDHTDFWLETHSSPKAKNLCQNIISPNCWKFSDVEDHFDRIILESELCIDGKWQPYQKDTVDALLPPEYWTTDLVKRVPSTNGLVFFSGTINALTGLRIGDAYRIRMTDPVLNRCLEHEYSCDIITGIEDQ